MKRIIPINEEELLHCPHCNKLILLQEEDIIKSKIKRKDKRKRWTAREIKNLIHWRTVSNYSFKKIAERIKNHSFGSIEVKYYTEVLPMLKKQGMKFNHDKESKKYGKQQKRI